MVGEGNTFTSCINFHLLFYFRFFFFICYDSTCFRSCSQIRGGNWSLKKVLQKTRFLLRSNSLPPSGGYTFLSKMCVDWCWLAHANDSNRWKMIFFCFFCGIFAYGAADSRLSTLFRTNGNATADILIAVIKTFPTTDCIYDYSRLYSYWTISFWRWPNN